MCSETDCMSFRPATESLKIVQSMKASHECVNIFVCWDKFVLGYHQKYASRLSLLPLPLSCELSLLVVPPLLLIYGHLLCQSV